MKEDAVILHSLQCTCSINSSECSFLECGFSAHAVMMHVVMEDAVPMKAGAVTCSDCSASAVPLQVYPVSL